MALTQRNGRVSILVRRCAAAGCVALCVLLGHASPGSIPEFDLGFVASKDQAPDGSVRLRGVGPILERQDAGDARTFKAVRPLFSSVGVPAEERVVREYLWPLGYMKHARGETDWRFLTAFGHDFDNEDPESRYRCWVLPVLFTGRDKGGRGYFAMFPVGGSIREFLGRDEIHFALFPLYARSKVNEVETHDVLWPIFSRTEGDGISRLRAFPLYGRSWNRGRWEKRFVLWPIWTSVRYDYPDAKGGGFVLFPLFGHVASEDQETWFLVPPFFRWSESEKLKKVHAPYPFVQYSSGEVDKLYVWPAWGRKSTARGKSGFCLWPIVSWDEVQRRDATIRRSFILPFLFHETHRASSRPLAATGAPAEVADAKKGNGMEAERLLARYLKFWPLLSYRREGDAARLRLLDLWPGKDLRSVEKNYAPLWTLYTHIEAGDETTDEVLWGLFRHRRSPDGGRKVSLFPLVAMEQEPDGASREWSFLLGLLKYRREGLQRKLRLLYFLNIGEE